MVLDHERPEHPPGSRRLSCPFRGPEATGHPREPGLADGRRGHRHRVHGVPRPRSLPARALQALGDGLPAGPELRQEHLLSRRGRLRTRLPRGTRHAARRSGRRAGRVQGRGRRHPAPRRPDRNVRSAGCPARWREGPQRLRRLLLLSRTSSAGRSRGTPLQGSVAHPVACARGTAGRPGGRPRGGRAGTGRG